MEPKHCHLCGGTNHEASVCLEQRFCYRCGKEFDGTEGLCTFCYSERRRPTFQSEQRHVGHGEAVLRSYHTRVIYRRDDDQSLGFDKEPKLGDIIDCFCVACGKPIKDHCHPQEKRRDLVKYIWRKPLYLQAKREETGQENKMHQFLCLGWPSRRRLRCRNIDWSVHFPDRAMCPFGSTCWFLHPPSVGEQRRGAHNVELNPIIPFAPESEYTQTTASSSDVGDLRDFLPDDEEEEEGDEVAKKEYLE